MGADAESGERPFGRERAREVLAEACRAAGLAPEGAREVAFGENAVFDLEAEPVVVRIGRSAALLDRARREAEVAAWLAAEGVPAVRPAAGAPGALLVAGHPVTFWDRLPEPVRPAGGADLGALLRRVHALGEPRSGCPAATCSPESTAGWRRPPGTSTPPMPPTCSGGATPAPSGSPGCARCCSPVRSTATPCRATCTSARTARSWSTWRPSPPTCASTTWW
ncbi:phosphotransferase [Nocardiopsis composta]